MDIVEFVENVAGLKLMDFQKQYLTRVYDIYEKDPESFNKYYHSCRRYTRFDVIPLFTTMFDSFNKEQKRGGEQE